MSNKKTAKKYITQNHENGVVWGSIDPPTGDISLYGPAVSATIESQRASSAAAVVLDIFGGVNIPR